MATVAVFIALGGVSWAAVKLPKNSVTNKSIKKNAVTGAKVKNRSLTGDDIKRGSLDSSEINESALSKVPSATTADSAATAGSVANRVTAYQRVPVSTIQSSPTDGYANATEVPLFSHGAVTVYAKCFASTAKIYAVVIGRTSSDYAMETGRTSGGDIQMIGKTTGEVSRAFNGQDADQDAIGSVDAKAAAGQIIGPDGAGLSFSVSILTRFSSAAIFSPNAWPGEQSCIFIADALKFG
jgi:hypothetical protein